MTITLKYTNDAFPPGTEFSLDGVGILPNGEDVELTEEQEQGFAVVNKTLLQDSVAEDGSYTVTGAPTVTSVEEVLGVNPEEISTETAIPEPALVEELSVEPTEQTATTNQTTIELGQEGVV